MTMVETANAMYSAADMARIWVCKFNKLNEAKEFHGAADAADRARNWLSIVHNYHIDMLKFLP